MSVESERALLGGLILAPDRLSEIGGLVTAADFVNPHHSRLFQLLLGMQKERAVIDVITVPERIAQLQPGQFGGLNYVLQLPDMAVSTSNLDYYAKEIARKSGLREFAAHQEKLAEYAKRPDVTPEELAALADQHMRKVVRRTAGVGGGWQRYDLDAIAVKASQVQRGEASSVLPTGFEDLDHLIGGLDLQGLTILAARPGVGKTSFALGIAHRVAMARHYVAFFSLEMGTNQLAQRAWAMEAGVPYTRINRGTLSPDDWERLWSAQSAVADLPVFIDDSSRTTIADIRSRLVRLEALDQRPSLVVVDYLQLITPADPRQKRNEAVGDISGELKTLAKETGIPFLVLSQLSRDIEKRSKGEPQMSDLRDSGKIEQDADMIMFLHRDKGARSAQVHVVKNRHGEGGVVPLRFVAECTRFEDVGL